MNDFTKDELINLFDCCKSAYRVGEINPQIPLKLKGKLQNMVNNYCEPDWRKGVQMNDFTKEDLKEMQLVHRLEKLHQFLHGAHSACDHDNSSATFHQACHITQDIINWIRNDE